MEEGAGYSGYVGNNPNNSSNVNQGSEVYVGNNPGNKSYKIYTIAIIAIIILIVASIVVFIIIGPGDEQSSTQEDNILNDSSSQLSDDTDGENDTDSSSQLSDDTDGENDTDSINNTMNNITQNQSNDNIDIENPYEGQTVTVWGKQVEQGTAIYNQYNSEACEYRVYFRCDVLEKGCVGNNNNIMALCEEWCNKTNGITQIPSAYALLGGDIIQCQCTQCLPIEGGEKDFDFFIVNCQDSLGETGIDVKIENTGEDILYKEDWEVHKIDNISVDLWPFEIQPGRT